MTRAGPNRPARRPRTGQSNVSTLLHAVVSYKVFSFFWLILILVWENKINFVNFQAAISLVVGAAPQTSTPELPTGSDMPEIPADLRVSFIKIIIK
jgi:hypothetical protein